MEEKLPLEEEEAEELPKVFDVIVRFVLPAEMHPEVVGTLWDNPMPEWLVTAEVICEGVEREPSADEYIAMGLDHDPENDEDV